jgi:hypothetical protein
MDNSKILYCTIAVGDYYLNSAINIAESLNKYSNNHHMLIVSDVNNNPINNTTFKINCMILNLS